MRGRPICAEVSLRFAPAYQGHRPLAGSDPYSLRDASRRCKPMPAKLASVYRFSGFVLADLEPCKRLSNLSGTSVNVGFLPHLPPLDSNIFLIIFALILPERDENQFRRGTSELGKIRYKVKESSIPTKRRF